MLKNFVNFAKPSTFQVLRSFLSSRRNFSAAKEDAPNAEPEEKQPEAEIPIEPVKVEKSENITLIGINRPEVRNCVNSATAQLLSLEIEKFENDPDSPVAILYGIGGNFCAGYDLKELKESEAGLVLKSEGAMGPTRRLITKPLIAAVNGYCVAGGLELAIMCDLRVMECDAVMGFYNRRFGVPLVDGATVRLPAMIGLSRALDLVLTGRQITSKEALEIGLANRIVATGTSLGQALNLATLIAKYPQKCLNHDRASLFNAVYNATNKDEALDFELMSCGPEIIEEAKIGAERFVTEGFGKHGSFANIKPIEIPDWEKEEIKIEKENRKPDAK